MRTTLILDDELLEETGKCAALGGTGRKSAEIEKSPTPSIALSPLSAALVHTSVWIDHFRRPNTLLSKRLETDDVWIHPFVVGELACGNLSQRREILRTLAALHSAPLVNHDEVLQFVEDRQLNGLGLGWVDNAFVGVGLRCGARSMGVGQATGSRLRAGSV